MPAIKCQSEAELVEAIRQDDPFQEFSNNIAIKIDRETLGWKLLQENRGKYSKQILNQVFDAVDGVGTKAYHFGSLLATPNRNLIFKTPIEEINEWVETLLFSDIELDQKFQECLVNNKIKGASKGIVTLLLYLSDSEKYNVWVNATEKGLSIVERIPDLKGKHWGQNFQTFNKEAIEFRNSYGFKPQEVDWVLSLIGRRITREKNHYILNIKNDENPMKELFTQFKQFNQDPYHRFIVKLRRKRAEQLRNLLSDIDKIELETFNYEVWQSENKTLFQGKDVHPVTNIRNRPDSALIDQLEKALDTGTLELHGNYIWGSGSRVYLPREKNDDRKVANIREALSFLNDSEMTPLEKVNHISGVKGFGQNISSGLVMVYHPDDFAIYNKQAIEGEIAKKSGFDVSSLQKYQNVAEELKNQLGAKDFLELDWFLFVLNQEGLIPKNGPSFWWVNQGSSFETDKGQKYLFAPKKDKGEKTPYHWKNVSKVKEGDIVFNYVNKYLKAISLVKSGPYDFIVDEEGTRVDIELFAIDEIPHSKFMAKMEDFNVALSGLKGPFTKFGSIKEGYLFEFNLEGAKIVREIYGKPFPEPIEKYFETAIPGGKSIWMEIKDSLSISKLGHEFSIATLYFENKNQIEKRIQTALKNGDHIILIGTPGTGKSKLAKEICEFYCDEHDYFMSTATSDWSTFESIGGYRPDSKGMLKFYPGIFLKCFRNEVNIPANQWLIIDEINRADIDKAFGSLFSALTGDDISLPFDISGEPLKIIGKPNDGTEIKTNIFIIPPDWRIIATMNTFDKASLYEMSYAFMRRFAFVPVGVPNNITPNLLKRYIELWNLEINDDICLGLTEIWSKINARRKVGPAIIEDMYEYILDTQPPDYTSAIIMYILPQFEGLIEDEQINFIREIVSLGFIYNKEELVDFASDFFGIEKAKFK